MSRTTTSPVRAAVWLVVVLTALLATVSACGGAGDRQDPPTRGTVSYVDEGDGEPDEEEADETERNENERNENERNDNERNDNEADEVERDERDDEVDEVEADEHEEDD